MIAQSSGKQRVIDDAFIGGQSALSADSNKLVLCSALRPAQHLQCAFAYGHSPAWPDEPWESGGEDWPNAYRYCPMNAAEAMGCIVTFFHREWQQAAFMQYTGLLFGLPLAVTSFNRYSRFVEAACRRLTFCLVTSYFDDFSITDRSCCRGSAQFAIGELNKLLGTPFSEEKQQQMSPHGTFLGLDHDFSKAHSHGQIFFWARERIQEKLTSFILSAQETGSFPPGIAAKVYGVANFFEMGVWGRIGCGGLAAIKERQEERTSMLAPALSQCFEILLTILKKRPKRCLEVMPPPCGRFVAASDAVLETPRQGTGGFCIVWLDLGIQCREAFIASIPSKLYDLWTPGDRKIAQLEMLMVLMGLLSRASTFRGRRGVWYIDNQASLMSLIRGRSTDPDLERMSNLIRIILFALGTWIYWEWVPSKSNWTDEISRDGAHATWHLRNDFQTFNSFFPVEFWYLPLEVVVNLVEFL